MNNQIREKSSYFEFWRISASRDIAFNVIIILY